MVRKSINHIFIYIISLICIGCESNILGNNFEGCTNDCVLEMDAQDLELDSNGFYHLNMIDGYVQTFTTLSAFTNAQSDEIYKVRFQSNKEINIEWMGTDNWTNLIYSNSYTDDDGYAYGVLGVYEEFVGDTITIYTGYEDNCYNPHFDSLKVVVNGYE